MMAVEVAAIALSEYRSPNPPGRIPTRLHRLHLQRRGVPRREKRFEGKARCRVAPVMKGVARDSHSDLLFSRVLR